MIYYRKATESDSQSIKDIAMRVISINYVPFLGAEATTAFINSGMSDKEIDDGLDNCILMICDEQIIGFAITKDDVLHLIMIDVPAQNMGYGSALLSYIEEKLFSLFSKICLQTFQENVSTVKFYLKNKWIVTAQEKVPELDKIMLQFEKHKETEVNGI